MARPSLRACALRLVRGRAHALGGHLKRDQIGHRFAAQGIQHGAAGGKTVGDPVFLAVLLQGRAALAAADVDLDPGIGHPLQLGDELPRAVLESRVFEHAEHAVVKNHGRRTIVLVGGDEIAHRLLVQCAGGRPHVELLVARPDRRRHPAVLEDEIDGHDEFDALGSSLGDHPLGLFDPFARNVVRLVLVRGVLGESQIELLAVQLGGRLLQRHGQRPGGNHATNLAAGDHRLKIVELVDFQAAEDHHLGIEAFLQMAVELLGLVLAQRHLLHGGRNHHAGGVQAAGRERLVDVDFRHLLGELVGQPGQLLGQLVHVGRLGLPQHPLDVVLPRVLQHDDAARRALGDGLGHLILDRYAVGIEPVVEERHGAAEDFAQPGGHFGERLFRVSADVPEDDLLPAPLLAELERIFHRPQPDIAVADFRTGLGVHVAANQHGRAAGEFAQAVHARNRFQIVFQAPDAAFSARPPTACGTRPPLLRL